MTYYLGKTKIKNKGVLAPMLEYTTLPFRLLCQKYGCALTYTEMVSINRIKAKSSLDEIDLLKSISSETCAVQLVGDFTNRSDFLKVIDILDSYKHFKIIDLNFGCPSFKVHDMKGGAILLSSPYFNKAIENITEAISITKKPITVKSRVGYSQENIKPIVNSFESAGVSAIAVHGRLANQTYADLSDNLLLERVAKDVSVPFIYNGDVSLNNFSSLDVCFSGLMVGRSALTNPFIFKSISKKKIFKKHQVKIIDDYLKLTKKHSISFDKKKRMLIMLINNLKSARKYRNLLSLSKTEDQINKIIDLIKKDNPY